MSSPTTRPSSPSEPHGTDDADTSSERGSQETETERRDWDWKKAPPSSVPEATAATPAVPVSPLPAIIQPSASRDRELKQLTRQHASTKQTWLNLFGRRPMEASVVVRVPEDEDPNEACSWLKEDTFAPRMLAVYPEICHVADPSRNPAGLNRFRRPNCTGPFVDYLCFFRLSGMLIIFNLFLLQEIPEPVRSLLQDTSLYLISCYDEHYSTALLNTDMRLETPPRPTCSLQQLLKLAGAAGLALTRDLADPNTIRELPLRCFGNILSLKFLFI